MKKKLSLLMVAFMAVAAFAVHATKRAGAEVVMKYTGTTTTNMTGENDAATLGLDAEKWSVIGAKGGNTNMPGLNKEGTIRLYYAANGSNTITVKSLTNATINSVTLDLKASNKNISVTVDGNAVEGTEDTYAINSTSFVLGNANTSNAQVHIYSVTINYTEAEPAAADTWTVAGSSTELFGTAWAPANEDNDMTLVDGLYTWTKSEVALPASTVEFKVAKNHAWDEAYPLNNYQLAIPETGKYNVTITFNADSKTVNATAEKVGDAVVEDKVVFLGSFNDWDQNATMTKGEGSVWTTEVDATEITDDIQFKLLVNGNWHGNGSGITFDAPENWVGGQDSGDYNYILFNSTTGYQTYTVTATCNGDVATAANWTLKIEGKDARSAGEVEIPEGAIVYDFAAAAAAGENPANVNGSTTNGTAFYAWESDSKTNSLRQDYKGYAYAEGSVLPEECRVWRRGDRINGTIVEGGLNCPNDKEVAINGVNAGDKVIFVYDASAATDKDILWVVATGEGSEEHTTAATVDGVTAVTGTTTIASGSVIEVTSTNCNYFVVKVKKGMVISKIAVVPAPAEAEIAKVEVRGAYDAEWQNRIDFELTKGEGSVYTGELDATAYTDDVEFKLVVNEDNWIGVTGLTIEAADGLVDETTNVGEGKTYNFILKNSTSGFKTYTFTATWEPNAEASSGWTLKIEGKDARSAGEVEIPEGAIVYDFAAAAAAGENPANVNGSTTNGTAFYAWESDSKTNSLRQDYKGYAYAEGSVLPEECRVWRRGDRINGTIVEGGLNCPNDKEVAINGVNAGDKVIFVYDASAATDKDILWVVATGEGSEEHTTAATVDGVTAVTGTTTIASGSVIEVTSTNCNYFVVKVKKGMVISKIAVVPGQGGAVGITAVKANDLKNAEIYNLNGQRVLNAQKGLYIINGKKVVMK